MNRAGINKENSSGGNPDQGRNSMSCFSSSNRSDEVRKWQDTIAALNHKLEVVERKNVQLEHSCEIKSKQIVNLQSHVGIVEKKCNEQKNEIHALKEKVSNLESITGPFIEMRKLIESVHTLEKSTRAAVSTGCSEEVGKQLQVFYKLVLGKLKVFEGKQLEREQQVVKGRLAKDSVHAPPNQAPKPTPALPPSQQGSSEQLQQSSTQQSPPRSDMNLRPRRSPVPPQNMVSTLQFVIPQPQEPAGRAITTPVQTGTSPKPGPSRGHPIYPVLSAALQPTVNLGPRLHLGLQRSGGGFHHHVSTFSDCNINLAECRKCMKIFPSWRTLQKHYAQVVDCHKHSSTSLSVAQGSQHGIASYDKDTDNFVCLCNKGLSRSRTSFKKHYIYYKAERLFLCAACQKRFLYECDLHSHMKTKLHDTNWRRMHACMGQLGIDAEYKR